MGNRPHRGSTRPFSAVHPHSRGEQASTRRDEIAVAGSSPLAWGTAISTANLYCDPRFIPTRVGNSPRIQRILLDLPVHPHSRGEQGLFLDNQPGASGSSPLAWGTADNDDSWMLEYRFIPTRVGNRSLNSTIFIPAPVHPHSRGEQADVGPAGPTAGGSSPLAWGTEERGLVR